MITALPCASLSDERRRAFASVDEELNALRSADELVVPIGVLRPTVQPQVGRMVRDVPVPVRIGADDLYAALDVYPRVLELTL
jgi:hypothetical protein